MESIYFLLGLFAITCFLIRVVSKKEREENWAEHEARLNANETTSDSSSIDENKNESSNKPDTLGLMFNSLQQFGCQPTVNDDGSLSVQYQGENFHIDFGGMYARVWDPMWAGIKADDPDLPKIREAVNATNFNFGPTIVLTAPDEKGLIGFHSRYDIMLHPACPDNAHYIKAVLDTFFDAKEHVRSNFQQINTQQIEKQKNRRPVGFSTTQKEE
ncbi:MAG: hypothetical protein HDS83_00110 [Bacteroidales bacterium]|nr:hypothetical protein [Bacteroidales bacterium]